MRDVGSENTEGTKPECKRERRRKQSRGKGALMKEQPLSGLRKPEGVPNLFSLQARAAKQEMNI